MPQDCQHIITDLKLIREGVSQQERTQAALLPTYAPVEARTPEELVVFAQSFADFLQFYETPTTATQSWKGFFDGDACVDIANEIVNLTKKTDLQATADIQRKLKHLRTQFEKSYTTQNDHQPHFALFLAFVRLWGLLTQDHTNTLTARHLDFYYRQILQLREKPATPTHAHLLVELQKNVETFLIAKGTSFKASEKDAKGQEVFFENARDLVANQAKVVALKTAFLTSDGKLCALPITNSDNGLQPELTSPDGSWQPFFNANDHKPNADIGFVVASHYLFLTGGSRTITLNITPSIAPHCLAFLTTEKGWLEKPLTVSDTNQLQISITGEDAAIMPYNTKTHGYDFQTDLPVLRVILRQEAVEGFYEQFKTIDVSQLSLTVAVDGLKNLAVSNDFGPVDISKPFQPFGALPQAGSALVVGSKELFQKNYSTAVVNILWRAKPEIDNRIRTDLLENGVWPVPSTFMLFLIPFVPIGIDDNNAIFLEFLSNQSTWAIPALNTAPLEADFSDNEIINPNAKKGFVKFTTNYDFGFTDYPQKLAEYLIAVANDSSNKPANPGPAPVAPTIDAISLSYTATDTEVAFFHIAPFGHKPVQLPTKLFPQFESKHSLESAQNTPVPPNTYESIAEFYVGISNLNPPQNLSLLFQVADGTANPLAQKPQPHLFWSYLSGDTWVNFQKTQVNDTTNELLNSGIVTLTFPQQNKATNVHTLMPTGLFWVKVAVNQKPDAVCKLVTVAAQALKATFADRQNDPAFTAQTLPAGTISKMEEPQAAVKKVEQPFSSFGGRGQESPDDFYTRVSERLRHRDRAVALWDYEHLILEAFPQVHRAKCLNHTQYTPNESGTGIYNELAPGHVTVVAIPNQQFQKAIDPLRPYTSLAILKEIELFLRKRTSCFVNLHINNPDFEEVKADFKVKFHVGIDESFHINLLKESITRYLSPWAYGGTSPTFGGKIYQSSLINFVEEQPYVDYVTDFKILDKNDIPQNEISPSKAVSILVSVAKDQHIIEAIPHNDAIINPQNCRCHA